MISTKIIKDSVHADNRLISIETKAPKFLDAECVTGDTKLHFERKGSGLIEMSVEEFYLKWTKGIKVPTTGKNLKLDFSNVELDTKYSFTSLSRALNKYDDYVGYLNRRYTIPHTNRKITGKEFINWYNIKESSYHYREYKSTLNKMQLRAMSLDTETNTTTNIKDIWIAGEKNIVKISSGSYNIKVSDNQLLYTKDGWKKAKDLIVGDFIFRISHKDKKNIPNNYLSFNRKIKPTLLEKQAYRCNNCKKEIDFSCDVHHILPVSKYPEYANDPKKVIALCEKCHIQEHTDTTSTSIYPGLYTIDNIELIGKEITYDIEVTHKDKTFVAETFVLHNCEKHRMISSNSSSSRAIPVSKVLGMKPFIPTDVRINEPGMQGYANLSEEDYKEWYDEMLTFYTFIAKRVETWNNKYNIHKQHLNRYLEPFQIQTKIMTATKDQWEYFLSLRNSDDADPNIQILAKNIAISIDNSVPQILRTGEWHLPYVDSKDAKDIYTSAARCARTSYKTHDGKETDPKEDKKLAKWLITNRHLTPFEHQASPLNIWEHNCRKNYKLYKKGLDWYSGNFKEWVQYRQKVEQ